MSHGPTSPPHAAIITNLCAQYEGRRAYAGPTAEAEVKAARVDRDAFLAELAGADEVKAGILVEQARERFAS